MNGSLSNFWQVNIDGIDVHYVHAKPDPKMTKGKKVIPLLIVHGWPGTIDTFLRFNVHTSEISNYPLKKLELFQSSYLPAKLWSLHAFDALPFFGQIIN